MALAAAGAVLAAIPALVALPDAARESALVEAWRAYGLLVFAGLFALLARRPLALRGLWELVLLHKLALTLTAALLAARGGAADTGTVLVSDGALSALLLTAYVLCRGWSAGRRSFPRPPEEPVTSPRLLDTVRSRLPG